MKFLICLLLSVTSSFAAPNVIETKSPTGKYIVRFEQASERDNYRATIISSDGIELFSFEAGLSIAKDSVIWNDSGSILAFASGAHFLMECFLLSIRDDQWMVTKVPSPEKGWDNFHQVPVTWKKNQLTLKVDGPYAGKSDGYHYSGIMKISIKDITTKISIVSEDINIAE